MNGYCQVVEGNMGQLAKWEYGLVDNQQGKGISGVGGGNMYANEAW